MTTRSLELFVKKVQPKVGLVGNDILFAYFVVEVKSKTSIYSMGMDCPRVPHGKILAIDLM